MNGLKETILSNPHIKSVWVGKSGWSLTPQVGHKEVLVEDLGKENKTVVSVKKSKKSNK